MFGARSYAFPTLYKYIVCLISLCFIQAALAIHGFAIRSFGYSHLILEEPNPLLM